MKPVIKIEHLSKQYRLGIAESSYGTLRESLAGVVRAPFKRLRRRNSASVDSTMWALKDVSFEVRPGEVVGLIGRNGAGKSTLLKIMSRITEPYSGRIELYGRLGSLLEVGTGFHPELTGRENVYLSGTILGMKREEITRKFDEIVAFSEIGEFLDTTVKHYSSGMYVRLAFAVAAHMEPEILLVDEVLAVGDFAFQQKCLNHISRLKQSGMTILLVSHNMAAIQSTCGRAIYMDKGQIAADGNPIQVIKQFRERMRQAAGETFLPASGGESESSAVKIIGFEMYGADGTNRRDFAFGESVRIRIDLHAPRRIESPLINFGVVRGDGVLICNFNNWQDRFKIDFIEGDCTLEGWLPPLRLIPDFYQIHVLVFQRDSNIKKDLGQMKPLDWRTFGDFSINGTGLTNEDGVFQQPAIKWVFSGDSRRLESGEINAQSVYKAFADEQPLNIGK